MKMIKVYEGTHRELKIEAVRAGCSMEGLASDLLNAAITARRKGKLKPETDAAASKKPRKPATK